MKVWSSILGHQEGLCNAGEVLHGNLSVGTRSCEGLVLLMIKGWSAELITPVLVSKLPVSMPVETLI